MPNTSILHIETRMVDGKKEFHLVWPSRSIPRKAFADIKSHLINNANYSAVHGAKLSMLKALQKRIIKKHGADISIDQMISIHDVVIKGKIISRYHLTTRHYKKIAASYNAGISILDLSEKYDLPPLNLLRSILLGRYDKTLLYGLFKTIDEKQRTALARKTLTPYDAVQFKLASDNDAESRFNQSAIERLAADRENEFVRRFSALGIRIKTQNELVAEQTAEFGRAIITPDILILDTVYINGSRVCWIDYKNYIGTTTGFIALSNRKQAARYVAKWGSGAIAYQYSFVDDLEIGDAMLLDAAIL